MKNLKLLLCVAVIACLSNGVVKCKYKLVKTLRGHKGTVKSVAFLQNSNLLAAGSSDKTIKIWNIDTGQCIQTLTGHENSVYSVAFPQNSNLLASGSSDGTIKIWEEEEEKYNELENVLDEFVTMEEVLTLFRFFSVS